MNTIKPIYWFDELCLTDIALVGGKNASLGELIHTLKSSGVPVPMGFAISAQVYRDFVGYNHLGELIKTNLSALNDGKQNLLETGLAIRNGFLIGQFSTEHVEMISEAYTQLCSMVNRTDCDVAVRSSATAEDLPEASFAGQQESYLNISGTDALLSACQSCFASLYTDRAIAYREEQGFSQQPIALSVGIQQMVRSDLACAGVMFTLDTESGFPDIVKISASWGLGESVVKGSVNPDHYMVYKPLLDNVSLVPIIEKLSGSKLTKIIYADTKQPNISIEQLISTVTTTQNEQDTLVLNNYEILTLARWACMIEQHYGRPMDIEWAKDGISGDLFIVQARPETIESVKDHSILMHYKLKDSSAILVEGASVGSAIASGDVYHLDDPSDSELFPRGAILVAQSTSPDWVPVMREAAGIITDTGGAFSHAAIVSRELKVPAIVGTGNASQRLQNVKEVTINCAEGAVGKVHEGSLPFETETICLDDIPVTRTEVMINVALPDSAITWWQLPIAGIGLTRMEFIISSLIRVHPMALLYPEKVTNKRVRKQIDLLVGDTIEKGQYFVDKLALSIGKIAASVYPRPAIVRMSDFKSNEYRRLLGGEFFELDEENPMLGLRGASRYYHPLYREAFQLECRAIKQVREIMGFNNVIVMIPFCRTPEEADQVLAVMAEAELVRGRDGLEIYVMCEIPSNVILADEFAKRFDGFSIGSNDLTQLVLGIDRDSSELKTLFDTGNDAVKFMIAEVIKVAHKNRCKVGICGQAPSDDPEFGEFLVDCGIDSISLNPDSVLSATQHISMAEKRNLTNNDS